MNLIKSIFKLPQQFCNDFSLFQTLGLTDEMVDQVEADPDLACVMNLYKAVQICSAEKGWSTQILPEASHVRPESIQLISR